MGRRKKKIFKTSKWESEACLIESEILRFEERNLIQKDKWKNVFYCKSKNPEGRMCVYWGRTIAEVGDKVEMKGRFKDDIFIVWSMMIRKKEQS